LAQGSGGERGAQQAFPPRGQGVGTMRLRSLFLVAFVAARLAKVVETLENLGKSLREETAATEAEFASLKANCSAETDARTAAEGTFTETMKVLTSAAEEAEAKLASIEQTIQEKKLELGQVEELVSAEKEALQATRDKYTEEQKAMEESKAELEKALAEKKDMALAATGSLRRLRKLDSALEATAAATAGAPAFLQVQKTETQVAERGADLEASLDKVRDELEELRKGLDEKVGAHQKRLDELHEELLPLERDVARLVPSRGNAEAEKTGAEAQKTDLERTQSKTTGALTAHEDFCKASLAALSNEAELRAEVQSALAGAAETLQSNVFTSLVERSAAALDIPVSFLQVEQKQQHMPTSVLLQTETLSSVSAALAAAEEPPSSNDPFADVKLRIRSLVDSLRAQRNEDVDMNQICSETEAKFAQEEALYKQEVDVQEATIQLHAALEKDCQSSADTAEQTKAEEAERQQHAVAMAGFAANRAAARSKDHELAKEVVLQAQTLVRDLFGVAEEAGAFLQATPSQAGQQAAAETALKQIQQAEKGLENLLAAHKKSAGELSTALEAVTAAGKATATAMQQQVDGLAVELTGHQDARLEAEQAKKNAAESLEAMDSNRETQRQQCLEAGSDGQDSMQRRQEEIASLQDALKVLDGESVPVGGSLLAKRSKTGRTLSPLDAAAYAMGISVRAA